jgi:hypothetical protein
VRYTVWSRGRPIGETDLGFHRVIESCRSGWFHPNADGERLMPLIASVSPAMRAYLHRGAVDAAGDPFVQPALSRSTLFADLAESFQHLQSLELELRRDDGSIVPTSHIGIQDTEQLAELGRQDLADLDDVEAELDEELFDAEAIDGELDAFMDEDAGLLEAAWEDGGYEFPDGWRPAPFEERPLERYQVHVSLIGDDAIS